MIRTRKLITPAFHVRILENFCQVFAEKSFKLVDVFKQKSADKNTAIDVRRILSKCTLDIICGKYQQF